MPYHWDDIENPRILVNITKSENVDYGDNNPQWIWIWDKISNFLKFECESSDIWDWDTPIDDIINTIQQELENEFPDADYCDIGILLSSDIPAILIPTLVHRLRKMKFRIFYITKFISRGNDVVAWIER